MNCNDKYEYVLATAARDEGQYIRRCIESVISQSVLPCKWVIVSNGSTDNTENIVNEYAKDYQFIQLIKKEPNQKMKGFANKVLALNAGIELLKGLDYFLIGHIDADITVGKDYYEIMLNKFKNNSRLGIAGGYIFEEENGAYRCRSSNSPSSVAGGIQLFNRKCYQDIGGLKIMPMGGEDWLGEIQARMHGWEVKAFPEVHVFHHKSGFLKRGMIREAIRGGTMDFTMGTHPLFEVFKCIRRIKKKPYFIFAIIRFYGFLRSYFIVQERHVTRKTMIFIRNEVKFNKNW